MDIQQQTNGALRELALFAGAGGGILGGKLLGWETVCAVEWDAYARDVLVARQNDGCLNPFPIWDDVQTFDGRPWEGCVDVVSGGFPCQDISAAGKGAGIEGERSGMWKHMARIIGEVRPKFAFVENSPMLVGRGLAVVLADLAALGYDARWGIVGAHHVSAPHKRDRIWIVATNSAIYAGKQRRTECAGFQREARIADGSNDVADTMCEGSPPKRDETKQQSGSWKRCENVANPKSYRERGKPRYICEKNGRSNGQMRRESIGTGEESEDMADDDRSQRQRDKRSKRSKQEHPNAGESSWWATEPDVGRVAHGVANRVDRLRCIGNGQVPAVARLAWRTLTNCKQ